MARKGLYANIHAKRKRGEKMRKKGAKGAPTAANFRRAKQTAKKLGKNIRTLKVDLLQKVEHTLKEKKVLT